MLHIQIFFFFLNRTFILNSLLFYIQRWGSKLQETWKEMEDKPFAFPVNFLGGKICAKKWNRNQTILKTLLKFCKTQTDWLINPTHTKKYYPEKFTRYFLKFSSYLLVSYDLFSVSVRQIKDQKKTLRSNENATIWRSNFVKQRIDKTMTNAYFEWVSIHKIPWMQPEFFAHL